MRFTGPAANASCRPGPAAGRAPGAPPPRRPRRPAARAADGVALHHAPPGEPAGADVRDFIASQASGVSEELFKGAVLGVDADVAAGGFRTGSRLARLAHLPDGLEPPPRLLSRVAVHYARNLLSGTGAIPGQVPLVLGVWGPKGAGKSFSLELCLKRMGVAPVMLSAGELEDEWAGEPGRRLRERYSFAARHAATTGEGTCLVISDLDTGVGTWEGIRNTVNTQILQGSLMALCDDPLLVSTGAEWAAVKASPLRVPIFVTANDLSLLYAPLVREGRMDKFYFEPDRGEMAGMVGALFSPSLTAAEVGAVLDAFPAQPIDFFGSVMSRLADDAVREAVQEAMRQSGGQSEAPEPEGGHAASLAALLRGAGAGAGGGAAAPVVTLERVLEAGRDLAREQQSVMDIRLAKQYMRGLDDSAEALAERERWRSRRRRRARPPPREAEADASQRAQAAARQRAELSGELSSYWDSLAANAWVSGPAEAADPDTLSGSGGISINSISSLSMDEEGAAAPAGSSGGSSSSGSGGGGPDGMAAAEAAAAAAASGAAAGEAAAGPGADGRAAGAGSASAAGAGSYSPSQLADALRRGAAVALDVRSARDWEWGRIKMRGVEHAPFVLSAGSSLDPRLAPNPDFLRTAAAKLQKAGAKAVVVVGPGAADDGPPPEGGFVSKETFVSLAPTAAAAAAAGLGDVGAAAAEALRGAGHGRVFELAGGFRAWDLQLRPDGRPRARGAFVDKTSGELEWWTASN
ncbi:ribulose bisphosphate carboxylase oxygenase, chloroplastic [Raphidocelis subcapitata]|uniref:Ribulose bisphosphate carboxylase/oxygenase activase, chloroplastic n=1 Tax=Raphidocelis subcapitata TaxID=307507 RepID=A0A2V0NVJ9_9CHLO|nr:ribulose bisphosphate carboxylase oxygenase, chloroplastic [Raphidocelis subcapitata]|eukprot:GBF91656.1 ribulose bisphosphate carboxylase oxygenase, chloroplastic [Raphidocelis subcapitata]